MATANENRLLTKRGLMIVVPRLKGANTHWHVEHGTYEAAGAESKVLQENGAANVV